MKYSKYIATTIEDYIKESSSTSIDSKYIVKTLINRIPFISEYKIIEKSDNRLSSQRIVFHNDVKVVAEDEIYIFPQYNISSEITYTSHKINDNTFHYFNIKNQFHTQKPNEMNDLIYRVFLYANKELEKKLSYHEEIMVSAGESLTITQIDKVINDMNKNLFEIEEFAKKYNIDLF